MNHDNFSAQLSFFAIAKQKGQDLSTAIWKLINPEDTYTTSYALLIDKDDDTVYFGINQDPIVIHENYDIALLSHFLENEVLNESITANEKNAILTYIDQNKGSRILVRDIIPSCYTKMLSSTIPISQSPQER